jgi:hypothetical protein
MPRVQNLFRAPKKHLPMEDLSEVRAVGDTGFEGCAHARGGWLDWKSVPYAPPATRWTQFVPAFRKSFGGGVACCAAFWRAE